MSLVRPEDWRPQGVDDLEPRAWEALRETDRSVLVTAGAGAGKTEFLAQKAAYLLQTGLRPAPKRILAISFKRDAARNLAIRVEKRCAPELARRFNSFTFDAFAKNLVDRFRAAIPGEFCPPADYQIILPTRRDIEVFLESHGIRGINAKQLEELIARTPLPFEANDAQARAVRTYWESQYGEHRDTLLSFPMINRLAVHLLEQNLSIRHAINLTYPVVFLDEFQDTTFPQYELLHAAFDDGEPVLTAVGDDKQRIMLWAGAMPHAFNTFERDYDALRISLVCNWRSHEDLVRIQYVIAAQIDPDVEHPEARAERAVDGDISAIWQFNTEAEEADIIAAWIAQEVAGGTTAPHDYAILVRKLANNVEQDIAGAFTSHDLRLRNVARNVGSISIQDVLTEELTQVLLPLLRLGSTRRSPENWEASLRTLQFLEAVDPADELGLQRLQQRLQIFIRELRGNMCGQHPGEDEAKAVLRLAMEFVQEEKVRQAFPEYQRQRDFDRVWSGLVALLQECTEVGGDWARTLDEFEGIGQVALMTIHKSKGLEFHTMIFYGLDNQTWRSLTPQRREELNAFFVAFTRAKQRAFFTFCAERGRPVSWIEHLLNPAGVRRVDGRALLE